MICCLQEAPFICKDTHRLKGKRRKQIFHVNENEEKAGVAILISDKTDFKTKTIKDKEGHYIMKKQSIKQEDIKIIFMHPT